MLPTSFQIRSHFPIVRTITMEARVLSAIAIALELATVADKNSLICDTTQPYILTATVIKHQENGWHKIA